MIAAALLLALSHATGPGCAPIPGAAPLVAMTERRAFIFGELHGTNEIPALFGDLVCEAAAQGPVIVGVEMQESSQAALDSWLASDGGAAALSALLRDGHWRFTDGRASRAMLALLERLRALRAAGRRIAMLAFVPATGPAPTQTPYEQAMAANWRRALAGAPGARLFVLVGNIHSRTAPYRDFEPAAMHLPRPATLTFSPLPVGGSANNCQAEDCGIHSVGPISDPMPPRGLIATPPEARATMPYDYLYSPGQALTGSPAVASGPMPASAERPGP
jgi:hypothetical protein